MECNLNIDGENFSYDIEGEFFWGADEVIFEKNIDTIENTKWHSAGYSVISLFDKHEFKELKNSLISSLRKIIFNATQRDCLTLDISKYHEFVDDKEHFDVISDTRFLDFSSFFVDTDLLCEKVSSVLKKNVETRNKELPNDIVILRISRPNSLDINPPHRDAYQKIWQRTINLWIPIIGCEQKSTLPLIPGSHFWNEKTVLRTDYKGATIDGKLYHVPGIASTKQGLNFMRPNPKIGDALIFSPYLIHGSALNQLADTTRISLEIRLPFI